MQSFTLGDIEIAVRELTVADDLHSQILSKKLTDGVPEGDWGLWWQFADLCSAAVSAKGLPFDPTTLYSQDKAEAQKAYDWYLQQPKKFKTRWLKAFNAENPADDPNE
jgi:hypothetical protein